MSRPPHQDGNGLQEFISEIASTINGLNQRLLVLEGQSLAHGQIESFFINFYLSVDATYSSAWNDVARQAIEIIKEEQQESLDPNTRKVFQAAIDVWENLIKCDFPDKTKAFSVIDGGRIEE